MSIGDRLFGESIKNFDKFVLGYFYFLTQHEVEDSGLASKPFDRIASMENSIIHAVITPDGFDLGSYPRSSAKGVMTNIPHLSKQTNHFAFFSNESDSDAIMRWVTLVKIMDQNVYPSLALKLAAESMNKEILVDFDSIGVRTIELIDREDESKPLIQIPVDPSGVGRMLINHHGPALTFPQISFADIYNDNLTDEQREQLRGSITMIGLTAIGVNDIRPTPFDSTIDGVEVHASALDNILSQNFSPKTQKTYTS